MLLRRNVEKSLPAPPKEASVEPKAPASIVWLRATDPRTFTPYSWKDGGMAQILFASPDNKVNVSITRTVTKDQIGGRDLQDEIHANASNVGTQLNYGFDSDGNITRYNPAQDLSTELQATYEQLEGLVGQKDSIIRVLERDHGVTSYFVSDGSQWIEHSTGTAVEVLGELAVGEPMIGQPHPRQLQS